MGFDIIYIAIHSRCGHEIRKSDYRIKPREDFRKLPAGEMKPLAIFCSTCSEGVPPTHFEIFEVNGIRNEELVSKTPIEKIGSTKL